MTSADSSNAMVNATLLYAASQGFLDILNEALKSGANPNVRGYSGYTPLMECACRAVLTRETGGHIQCAHSLIQAGARVNDDCDKGYTALFYAALQNQAEMCSFLVENGANVQHTSTHGKSVLMVAMRGASDTLFQQMIDWGADVNAKNVEGSALYRACSSGDLPKARMLVAAGARVDPDEPGQHLPVIGAIRSGDPALLQFILQHGPDLEAADRSGWTPLMRAVDVGADQVAMLLNAGASLENRSGQMALSMAKGRGRYATLDLLLSTQMQRAISEDNAKADAEIPGGRFVA